MRTFFVLLAGGCITGEDRAWREENCVLRYIDEDGDGVSGGEHTVLSCVEADGTRGPGGDCDDGEPAVYPGADDVCGDGIDQDCSGLDAETTTYYADNDQDGYGDPDSPIEACEATEQLSDNALDCNDSDSEVSPEARESVCGDAVDEDCDGEIECAMSGEVEVDAEGTFVALGSGGGGALAAGEDLDGDGTDDAVVGGGGAVWLVVGVARQTEAVEWSLGWAENEEAGADVALLAGVGLVGAPAYDIPDGGTGLGKDAGRVYVGSGESSKGTLEGAAKASYAGLRLEAAGGALAVASRGTSSWDVYLLAAEDLPSGGETYSLDGELGVPTLTGLTGSEDGPPALALAWEDGVLKVAVGQPEDDSGNRRVKLYDGDGSEIMSVMDSSSGTTLGTAVTLIDLDASGIIDLVVGEPGADTAHVFLNPTDDLSAGDADCTLNGAEATGTTLAPAGDVNGDGTDDLLIGGTDLAYLVLGGDLPSDGDRLEPYATFLGVAGSGLGADMAGADLDGDGFSDLLLGAPDSNGIYMLWGGP